MTPMSNSESRKREAELAPTPDRAWIDAEEALGRWLRAEKAALREQIAADRDETDRNARAYGWEVGAGRFGLGTDVAVMSEDNPFSDPNWRARIARGDS